ncbi:Purple acid phosphatase [Aphelenchoides besseyi]|nr:Purple acid phosphatase [Aphelenchoides besseyi]
MLSSATVLVLLVVVSYCSAARQILAADRKVEWKTADVNQGPRRAQPEQIHLAYGGAPSRMSITWVTFDDTDNSFVQYGENGKFGRTVKATISRFVDSGKARTVRYIHRALIKGIQAGHQYKRGTGGFVYAIYGDLGYENARSLAKLNRWAQDRAFDMVIHNGDIAYDLDRNNGSVGDEFMRQIEPMSAYVPYMVTAGNHEQVTDTSAPDLNLYFSFDLGAAHFVTINSEAYYFLNYGKAQVKTQWNWLINDLKKAIRNRKNVPWIIMYAHRRMYCTDISVHKCSTNRDVMRDGFAPKSTYALEKLIHDYGVDLFIGAHEHSYERFWPIYKFKEKTNPFPEKSAAYSAFRSSNYGFARMQVFNGTHIHIQQIMAAKVSNDQMKRSKRSLDFQPSPEMQIHGISAIIIPIVIIVVCCFCLALFIALAVAHQHFEELRLAQASRRPTPRSHVERHEAHEESSLMHAACQPSVVVMDHGHA